MFKTGEVYLNPVTGERAVIRIGTGITGGERMVVDVYIQPGGRVMGEHIHPEMEERFAMLRGKVGFPNVLQLAVFAREFSDVMEFTRPPRFVQRILFGLLAPIARMLGYQEAILST